MEIQSELKIKVSKSKHDLDFVLSKSNLKLNDKLSVLINGKKTKVYILIKQ